MDQVIKSFFPDKNLYKCQLFGNGHIHKTYLLTFPGSDDSYILQQLNTHVFKQPEILVENHLSLLEINYNTDNQYEIPLIFPDKNGDYLHYDQNSENPWRLSNFIAGSYSLELMETSEQAKEAGKAYGWFLKKYSDLDPNDFREAIPDFHSLNLRLRQLREAIDEDKVNRSQKSIEIIKAYLSRTEHLKEIQLLVGEGVIPTRVTHNDTKINNVLFREEKAIAVIDLDTVGPGILLNDYGDALRTIANTALEDEKEIGKVRFDMEAFKQFTKGYIQECRDILVPDELKYLHTAPALMAFIIGIRFLADYLNGDIYFKTNYPEHNLTRSLVQLQLIRSIEEQNKEIKNIIKNT